MASEEIIAVEDLLAPITEDNPVGQDIRADSSPASVFYAIKDARNAARAAERNNMFDDATSAADDHWRKITQLAPDILKNHAKDLEVAAAVVSAAGGEVALHGL